MGLVEISFAMSAASWKIFENGAGLKVHLRNLFDRWTFHQLIATSPNHFLLTSTLPWWVNSRREGMTLAWDWSLREDQVCVSGSYAVLNWTA